MSKDIENYKAGLVNCEAAIDVIANTPLKLASDGRLIHAYNWLKEVEHNLKAAVAKAEAPESAPSSVDPA